MEVILTEITSSGNNLVLYLCNVIYHIYIHDIVMGHVSKGALVDHELLPLGSHIGVAGISLDTKVIYHQ
jgi:hypothetical protein